MKATAILFTALAGVTLGAHAGGLPYPPEDFNKSAVTRAEVRAELDRARAAGEIDYSEQTHFANNAERSLSSEAVRAELAWARAAGEISTGELDYPPVALGRNQ